MTWRTSSYGCNKSSCVSTYGTLQPLSHANQMAHCGSFHTSCFENRIAHNFRSAGAEANMIGFDREQRANDELLHCLHCHDEGMELQIHHEPEANRATVLLSSGSCYLHQKFLSLRLLGTLFERWSSAVPRLLHHLSGVPKQVNIIWHTLLWWKLRSFLAPCSII